MDQKIFWINFFSNFGSNLLATMFGVFIGLGLGLRNDRVQEQKRETAQKEKEEQFAALRKKEIVELLEIELKHNHEVFSQFASKVIYTEESFDNLFQVANGGTTEVWRALSDGGEIKWINDNKLLVNLSWAYALINRVLTVGKPLIEITYYSTPRSGPVIKERLQRNFENEVNRAIMALEAVLDIINKYKNQNVPI